MKKKPQKPFWEMTPAERTEATKEFDKEIPASKVRSLTKAERERFERSRKAQGSICVAQAKKTKVTLRVDETLLSRVDRLAEQRGMTRDEVVERSFRSFLVIAQ